MQVGSWEESPRGRRLYVFSASDVAVEKRVPCLLPLLLCQRRRLAEELHLCCFPWLNKHKMLLQLSAKWALASIESTCLYAIMKETKKKLKPVGVLFTVISSDLGLK